MKIYNFHEPEPGKKTDNQRSSHIQNPSCHCPGRQRLLKWYGWWKKSCTTWHVWNPVKNGIFTISTGAGFLPSTVGHNFGWIRFPTLKDSLCFGWSLDFQGLVFCSLVLAVSLLTSPEPPDPNTFSLLHHVLQLAMQIKGLCGKLRWNYKFPIKGEVQGDTLGPGAPSQDATVANEGKALVEILSQNTTILVVTDTGRGVPPKGIPNKPLKNITLRRIDDVLITVPMNPEIEVETFHCAY